MIKKLLLCAFLIPAFINADVNAQGMRVPMKLKESVVNQSPHRVFRSEGTTSDMASIAPSRSHIDLKENELWWGYFNGKFEENDPFNWPKIGYGAPITYACCIRVLADNEFDIGKGKTIEGIKFAFPKLENIEDVQIWISTELPEEKTMGDADICVKNIDKSTLVQALDSDPSDFVNEIRFDKPYTIADKDVYVGYTFRVTSVDDVYDECPVTIVDEPFQINAYENAFLWRYDDDTEWYEEDDGDILAMQVLFSGDFKKNAVNIVESFEDVAALKSTETTVPVEIRSIGKDNLQSFKYVVKMNGVVTDEQTITLDQTVEGVGAKYEFEIPIQLADQQGLYETAVTISEVNGKENEAAVGECVGDVIVLDRKLNRKVLVEDFTGTWIRGAAFGLVNMQKLKEMYGDDIIPISAHIGSQDPMTCSEYDDYAYFNDITSLPTSNLDRTLWDVYPYLGSSEEPTFTFAYPEDVKKAQQVISVASVGVVASLSEDEKTVDIEASTTFAYSGDKANYALFYVLTEDGMQDESWTQKNGMQIYANMGVEDMEPLFAPWINGEEEITGVVYEDVAVAGYGVYSGIEGSIEAPIEVDKPQVHTISFDLAEYPIIQNVKNLNACVVLLNTKSGKVVNAARCKVTAFGETSISELNSEKSTVVVERYTVDGRRMSAPVSGINIVKYDDGRVEKQIVE